MTKTERLERMLAEFKRVGVDPDTVSAGLAIRPEELLRVLAALPDNAGPEAFLAQLRLTHQHR